MWVRSPTVVARFSFTFKCNISWCFKVSREKRVKYQVFTWSLNPISFLCVIVILLMKLFFFDSYSQIMHPVKITGIDWNKQQRMLQRNIYNVPYITTSMKPISAAKKSLLLTSCTRKWNNIKYLKKAKVDYIPQLTSNDFF